MKNTKMSVIITLWALMGKSKKSYATPSWHSIETLLLKYHKVKVKRRWIFQCLRDMADEGLVARRKRYRLNGEAKIEQLPGIITFTLAGLKYLVAKKVAGAYQALKDMMAWIQGKDRRFPERKDIAPDMSDAEIQENLGRLRDIIREIV